MPELNNSTVRDGILGSQILIDIVMLNLGRKWLKIIQNICLKQNSSN